MSEQKVIVYPSNFVKTEKVNTLITEEYKRAYLFLLMKCYESINYQKRKFKH